MTENRLKKVVLIAFSFSGAAALIYEVVWTRALSFILGSTVYAMSTMLATFMAGLALGGFLGGRLADREDGTKKLYYFAFFELGIGVFGLITVPVIYSLPPIYFSVYRIFHLYPPAYFTLQFAICAALMIIPTTLMGATFPVVSKWLANDMADMGKTVGTAYSMNTLGAIVGSITAGFVLIPTVGIKWASFTGGALNIITASAILFLIPKRKGPFFGLAVLVLIPAALIASSTGLKHPFATFYQVMRYNDFGSVKQVEADLPLVFNKEYAQGQVSAYLDSVGQFLVIQTDGKVEGTATEDMPNTMMLAALPVAALPQPPKDVFIIGLGAGVSSWTARRISEDSNIEVAEINPGVIEAVKRFGLPETLDGLDIHLEDAWKYLFLHRKKYDLITSEPSVPTEAAAANLFTREFYEIISSRLNGNGIFCQWLPAWILTRQDARACIKTFASVFNYSYLFRVADADFILLGSNSPFTYSPQEIISRGLDLIRADIPSSLLRRMRINPGNIEPAFKIELIRDEKSIQEILAMRDVPILTNDRPRLEFIIARNMLLGPEFKRYRK